MWFNSSPNCFFVFFIDLYALLIINIFEGEEVGIIHESSLFLLLYCMSFSPGSVLAGAL